jgi:hypothetical protein
VGPGTLSCLALLVAILLTLNGPVLFNTVPILAPFIISVWILVRLLRQTLRQQAVG